MNKFSLFLGPLIGGALAVVLLNDFRLGVTLFIALAVNNIVVSRKR